MGFKRGGYVCRCKAGYNMPENQNSHSDSFNGSDLEKFFSLRNSSGDPGELFRCDCLPCFAEYGVMMRGIPLGIQSFCMTISLVLAFVILRLRKTKVGWLKDIVIVLSVEALQLTCNARLFSTKGEKKR